ncbi:DNA-directed DNA polymerase [Synchytrium microbalum]|uniref:DNA polymerase n=1 Tax=Synchytrium microbalum TaxID=1806994 RepID=A0A507CE87_9FUNG|nr:DNA-directed DNA polymerase [Synchytrium microbalum]TPX37489.1 DNA-directed DNA polymerase [Synchytrium microbalum]
MMNQDEEDGGGRRSRRQPKAKQLSRADQLRAFREAKEGHVSRLDQLGHDDVFDLATEDEYTNLVRNRLKQPDFVVDDDGAGYLDHGHEEWDEEEDEYSEDEEEEEELDAKGKRKRDKKNKKKNKHAETELSAMFAKAAQNAPAPKRDAESAAQDAAVLDDILGGLDDEDQGGSAPKRLKPNPVAAPAPKIIDARLNPYRRPDSKKSAYTAAYEAKLKAATLAASTPRPFMPTGRFSGMGASSNNDNNDDSGMYDDDNNMDVDQQQQQETEHLPGDDDDGTSANEPGKQKPVPNPQAVKVRAIQTRGAAGSSSGAATSFVPKFAAPAASIVKQVAIPGLQGWESIRDSVNIEPTLLVPTSVNNTLATDGNHELLEEDGSLKMYWFDMTEVKNVVYVFGKVYHRTQQKYISCCVVVNNIQRNLFILPRKREVDEGGNETDVQVTWEAVHNEFNNIRQKAGITEWGVKPPVKRKYAFEIPGVPEESDYMKVLMDFKQPALPGDRSGRTFSHIFGTNTSASELFILKRKLKGPSWIIIKDAQLKTKLPTSWCKVEVVVDDPKTISVLPPDQAGDKMPPLVVMSLNIKTVYNHQARTNEIVMASMTVFPSVKLDESPASIENLAAHRFSVIRQLNDVPFPVGFDKLAQERRSKLEIQTNERALLNYMLAVLHKMDPDVIVGHNFLGFDLDVLLHRMKAHNVSEWSRLGRLRRKEWPKLQAGAGGMGDSSFSERQIAAGRLICDTYLAAKDSVKSRSYSLTVLALSQLKVEREEVDFDKIPEYFWDARQLIRFVDLTETDTVFVAQLMFKLQVLQLTKQLTELAGNLWVRTMTGARAERNEYLLLHEFHGQKYIVPDRFFGKNAKVIVDQGQDDDDDDGGGKDGKKGPARRKPQYAGGLVLEPKKGFYDKFVLLLDFNSLYPSIIQEFNICFSTVTRSYEKDGEVEIPKEPSKDLPQGILPRLLANLVARRRNVKNAMKGVNPNAPEYVNLDIRQKALKLTANSMYGCLGFSHSRFYAKPLAMLITSKGREILQNTVNLAGTLNLDVIYGDTDSIMIYTNKDDLKEVTKVGDDFKKVVNTNYKLLEIEIDGIFQRMLLLKKKKYAALVVEQQRDGGYVTTLEMKGLDLVRRDWCDLSHVVSQYVLDQIMSGESREVVVEKIHEYLKNVARQVRESIPEPIPIAQYGLTKNPEDYADKKAQPHVMVAMAMKAKGVGVRVGDTIPYVICIGEDKSPAARAYHPDDVEKAGSTLKIDLEYYLGLQVHPPVVRLCSEIEGTSASQLADCLAVHFESGLDGSKYKDTGGSSGNTEGENLHTLESMISDEEKYRNVDKFIPLCKYCKTQQRLDPLVRNKDSENPTCILMCSNVDCSMPLPTASLYAQLSREIRDHIKKYQNSWLVCDDAACRNRTRHMSVYGERCLRNGCRGAMTFEYPNNALCTQLEYYANLFDFEKFKKKLERDSVKLDRLTGLIKPYTADFQELKALVDEYLETDARRYVQLEKIFAFQIKSLNAQRM